MKEKRVVNSPALPLAQPNYTTKPLRKFPTLVFARSTHFLRAIEFVFDALLTVESSIRGRKAPFRVDSTVREATPAGFTYGRRRYTHHGLNKPACFFIIISQRQNKYKGIENEAIINFR